MAFNLGDWIYKYYVEPVVYETGYNPINTLTWALILGIMILVIIKLFRRLELKMDERLIIYTLPYILAGSSLRVIEDADLVAPLMKYFLITPLIYFLVFSVTVSSLLITRKIIGSDFFRVYAAIGLIWLSLNLATLTSIGFDYPWVILAVLLMGSIITVIIYLLKLKLTWLCFLDNKLNLLILYVHMLDASSTYIGMDWFEYYEEHVVPTLLINFIGTAMVMFPLKILIILAVLSLIDKSLEDPSLRNLTKLVLITLGLAPAARNTLRLALGI
jgi:uncharacterized membrane protein